MGIRVRATTILAGVIAGASLLTSVARPDIGPRHFGVPDATARSTEQSSYGNLPIAFEPAPLAAGETAHFVAHGPGYSLSLTDAEAVLDFREPGVKERVLSAPLGARNADLSKESVLGIRALGANSTLSVSGLDALPGKANYLIGNDPRAWRIGIPTYAKVIYRSIYPGVDLVYDGSQGLLEQDFMVAPEANPGAIRLSFTGADAVEADKAGGLIVTLHEGAVHIQQLHLYQQEDGRQQEIDGSYRIDGGDEVGFRVASYDRAKPLVIDPVLTYSTYLGGTGTDVPLGIAVDGLGNAYVTGDTQSTDFPTASPLQATLNGGQDAFVAKLDPAGNALVYSTYLGGSGSDEGRGIAVDSSGNAYVVGSTTSTDFPTVGPLQAKSGGGGQDAFVAKLSASGGALLYSTYLGGSLADSGVGIALDSSANGYITGYTASADFPTASPSQISYGGGADDAFVAKLNSTGSALVYSTYLGGNGSDFGIGIAVDGSGNVNVTGSTFSTDFPTASPLQATNGGGRDAFVAKLNASGSALVYSTYLGGSADDAGAGIAIDTLGNAHVSGYTASTNFPTASPLQATNAGGDDVFVAKLNASGSALIYSTYLGGSGEDINRGAIAVDSLGDTILGGDTASTNFPTASPFQASLNGGQDAFVAKLSASGSALIYSSYLGGSGVELGYSIALDMNGYAYVTGATNSGDFPTVNAFQGAAPNGGFSKSDGFVVKLFPFGLPRAPNITSVFAGNQSATISWTAPLSDGGSSITGYRVTPYIGAIGQSPTVFNSAALIETVTGLMNGSPYTFTVAAINGAGVGAESSHSSVVTPEPPAPRPIQSQSSPVPPQARQSVNQSSSVPSRLRSAVQPPSVRATVITSAAHTDQSIQFRAPRDTPQVNTWNRDLALHRAPATAPESSHDELPKSTGWLWIGLLVAVAVMMTRLRRSA